MKKFVLLIHILIINIVCSQESEKILVNKWKLDFIESSDLIEFKEDGKYVVFNDSALKVTANETDTIVSWLAEKGNWGLIGDSIKIFNREIIGHSDFRDFRGEKEVLFIRIKKVTKDTLKLCYSKEELITYYLKYDVEFLNKKMELLLLNERYNCDACETYVRYRKK